MFDWIGEAVQAVTLAYLLRTSFGALLAGGALWGTIVIARKHRDPEGGWKFSPRLALDLWAAVMISLAASASAAILIGLLEVR